MRTLGQRNRAPIMSSFTLFWDEKQNFKAKAKDTSVPVTCSLYVFTDNIIW